MGGWSERGKQLAVLLWETDQHCHFLCVCLMCHIGSKAIHDLNAQMPAFGMKLMSPETHTITNTNTHLALRVIQVWPAACVCCEAVHTECD